jgi:predicted DNA binding CopG/RHH family protein
MVSQRLDHQVVLTSKPVTLHLLENVVIYFKSMAEDAGVPYQSLINLYLRDCLANNRKVQIHWPKLG